MSLLPSRFVFLVLSLVTCAICVAIPTKASPALHSQPHQKRHNDGCGFSGNSDLYGLGIRLGVYFQWASSLIIYGWYPEGRNDLAESYLGFLVAITIAIIVITARAEPTYAVEIFVLAYIIFGGLITVTLFGFREHHRKRVERTHDTQLIALCVILASAGIYYSWFWLHGIHHNVLETPCGTFGFLFTKVSLYNPSVYKFFAALSVFLGGIYGYVSAVLLVIIFLIYLQELMKPMFSHFKSSSAIAEDGNSTTSSTSEPPLRTAPRPASVRIIQGLASASVRFVFRIGTGVSLFSLAYSVIGIEMTLYWNSISDVYTINTTGQLIPFVIGLLGLVKVIYKPISMWEDKLDAESIDAGEEVGQEAVKANRRLGYLDLYTPVEESTIRKLNKNRQLIRRRTRRISQSSRPTSPSP